jgi:aminopeptidase N
MRDNHAPKTIYLKDYQVPSFLVHETLLRFELDDDHTRVVSQLKVQRNKACQQTVAELVLDGCDLVLESLTLNDHPLLPEHYDIAGESLSISDEVLRKFLGEDLLTTFRLGVVTRIKPQENTSLEGLYISNGMYCTQCEAEGFRKITYYPDRPDVMSRFTTTIEADRSRYPQLLSNGNLVATGEAEGGRHWATWQDPFKKPAYLFALVAGDLSYKQDTFTTVSGREVVIRVYVEPHDLDKVDYAIDSLKRAMTWDEQVYGCEYDLEIYMIVAVSHFNMGAMENKGLNIFNTSCVLANPKTTTDVRFQRVEGVIAHEYFHNWSGNRVTCRDWFQLSLKEGFTVFRDQEFSADMGSRAIKRVEDVQALRTYQFSEDAGPMAHPVRPDAYMEINNFYTVTVYEKGAEVVRMIHTLLGEEGFRKGSDLYFKRHDGQAVTCDDFLAAMAAANNTDLSTFQPWYYQAGTPEVHARGQYDAINKTFTLTLAQRTPSTPSQLKKSPVLMPIKMGLLEATQGQPIHLMLAGKPLGEETVLWFDQPEQSFVFEQVAQAPVPSLLRGFSAPVKLFYDYEPEELAFLAQHDTDAFNRWEALDRLVCDAVISQISVVEAGQAPSFPGLLFEVYERVLTSTFSDIGEQAQLLTLPTQGYVSQKIKIIAVDGLHGALQALRQALASRFGDHFARLYHVNTIQESYAPSPEQIAKRLLRNTCLRFLATPVDAASPAPVGQALAQEQFKTANNMTDQFAALNALVVEGLAGSAECLTQFYEQWKAEALVVDMWLSLQASVPRLESLDCVKALLEHPAFDWKSPNKIRSVVGSFASGNPTQFHRRDGAGYQFLSEVILRLNQSNPQIAARLVTPLTQWRRYDESRQTQLKAVLQSLQSQPDLSADVYELVNKSLKDTDTGGED